MCPSRVLTPAFVSQQLFLEIYRCLTSPSQTLGRSWVLASECAKGKLRRLCQSNFGSCHSRYNRCWYNNYCLRSRSFKGSSVKRLWHFRVLHPGFVSSWAGPLSDDRLHCIDSCIYVANVVRSVVFSVAGKGSRYTVQVYTPMFICFRYQASYRNQLLIPK